MVLVPDEVSGQIEAVRAAEDKGFAKWPAHMTLWFGFPLPGRERRGSGWGGRRSGVSPARVRLARVARGEGSKYVGAMGEGCEG